MRSVPIDRAAILKSAEKLLRQGKVNAAIEEYLCVVAECPRDWNSANVLGDLYVRAKQVDEAVAQFVRIADGLRDDGFGPKASAVYKKILKLAPGHEHALLHAAELAAAQGLLADARAHLSALADRREARGDQQGVVEIRIRLAGLDPADVPARLAGARARLQRHDTGGALEDLKQLSAYLLERDRPADAIEVLEEASALDPSDPQLLLVLAETHLKTGRSAEGLAISEKLVRLGGPQRASVTALAISLADGMPEASFQVVSLVADAAVAASDWTGAMSALRAYVDVQPGHLAALMRLVEIGVDAGLEADTYAAQGQLADAYLAAGSADEARFIAEDLVAREPWEPANIERYRCALVLSGDPDPDAVIADRLSGDSPFISIDLNASDDWTPAIPPAPPAAEPLVEPSRVEPPAAAPVSAPPVSVAGPAVPADAPEEDLIPDLEEFFAKLRADAAVGVSNDETAESQYERGLMLLESGAAGDVDAASVALEGAARAPRFRFLAATRLARMHRDRGQTLLAIDWFERAAEAPPPTLDDGRALLYELADTLESIGESSRALAVCMELYAEAGEYRDIAARLDRLAKVQAGG